MVELLRPEHAGERLPLHEPHLWVGDRRRFLRDSDLRSLGVYAFLYLATIGLGTAALAAFGWPLRDSLFEFTSAVGTVGLSSGLTTPATPAGPLGILTVGMFLGRLEFLIVFLFVVKVGQHLRAVLRT